MHRKHCTSTTPAAGRETPGGTGRDQDPGATLDDLREAVMMLEDTERTARRVLGGAHPTTKGIQDALQDARAALRARDGGVSAIREAVEKMTPGDA